MDAPAPYLSRTQIIAYELATLGIRSTIDDLAHLVWRVTGEDSLISRLLEEARWTISLLCDRMAVCALRDVGVSKHRLAVPAFESAELASRGPHRLRAVRHDEARLDSRDLPRIVAAVFAGRATLLAISAGCSAAYAYTHPLMAAFRAADAAIEAVVGELGRLGQGSGRRSRAPRVPRNRMSGAGTLLLLRDRWPRTGDLRLSARRSSRPLSPTEHS